MVVVGMLTLAWRGLGGFWRRPLTAQAKLGGGIAQRLLRRFAALELDANRTGCRHVRFEHTRCLAQTLGDAAGGARLHGRSGRDEQMTEGGAQLGPGGVRQFAHAAEREGGRVVVDAKLGRGTIGPDDVRLGDARPAPQQLDQAGHAAVARTVDARKHPGQVEAEFGGVGHRRSRETAASTITCASVRMRCRCAALVKLSA